MAETAADAADTGNAPWWEATPAGTPVLLAFVELEPVAPVWAGQETPSAEALRQRARYTAGVEFIAGKLGAAQPLHWRGDGVRLFFKGDERTSAVLRALQAAEAIRERTLVDLATRVRIAVHAAMIPWNPDATALAHPTIDLCEQLERTAPVDGITVTEDVYLALPEAEQRRFALLGVTAHERIATYVFPTNLAARRDTQAFHVGEELRLWDAFRRYAGSPEIRRLRYVGFPLQKKQPPSLDIREVFIAPEARMRARPPAFLPAVSKLLEGSGLTEKQFEPPILSEPITRLLGRRRSLVVLGDPGSGKTTVLRWLAVVAAGGPLSWAEHLGQAERLLPLMVSVGRLAEIRERLGAVGSVVDTLAVYFHDRNVSAKDELRDFLERVLESGECLVLLDGLDEVRSEARSSLLSWLETFCARFPRNRFVASARVVGYTGFSLPGGVETTLASFNDAQVRRYAGAFERACRRWENEGIADDVAADRESSKLLEALFKSPRLRDLARNPFLLSALVLIHRAEGQLPRHRVQAYEIFSRTLCETWSNARRVVAGESETRSIRYEEEAVPILGELALRMHQEWPAGAAPEAFVIQTLAEAIQARDGGTLQEAERSAKEFLDRAGKEVQILLERGAGQWGFLHLTFQEFFTAVGLLSSERFEEVAFEHLFDPRWEEVLRLGVGYMALIQKRAQATQRFIRKVMDHQERGDRRYLTSLLRKQVYLSALLASEAGDTLPLPLQQEIARAVADWNQSMPIEVVEPLLDELSLTDFKERLVDVMTSALGSQEEWTRARTVTALGALGGQRAQDTLLQSLRDTTWWVRVALCSALLKLDTFESVGALGLLARDAEHSVRMNAIPALFSSKQSKARDYLTSIARDPDPGVTASFISVIAMMAGIIRARGMWLSELIDPSALDDVLTRGLEHPEEAIARLAKRTLLMEKGEAFFKGTVDPADPRLEQVRQLFHLVSPQSIVSARSLDNEVPAIRLLAAARLALLKNERGISALLEIAQGSPSELRTMAVSVMGSVQDQRVVAALLGFARDRDPEVRALALISLGQLRAEKGEDLMIQALGDPNPKVRAGAITGIGSMESQKALKPLIQIGQKASLLSERQEAIKVLWNLSAKVSTAKKKSPRKR